MLDCPLETFTVEEFAESVGDGSASPRIGPMLVLSRKKDESIVINNDITIVVVEIRGDKVRLGVEAPKEVPVHRREVFEAIARGEPVDAASVVAPAVGATGVDPEAARAAEQPAPPRD
jgi:carbon storage regulator